MRLEARFFGVVTLGVDGREVTSLCGAGSGSAADLLNLVRLLLVWRPDAFLELIVSLSNDLAERSGAELQKV